MAELSRAATATKARIAELRAELQGTMPASSFLMTGAGKLVAMARRWCRSMLRWR
jgi:hypothetical protein